MARQTRRQSKTPTFADPSDVRDFAVGLSPTHLQCRELGHNWRPYTAQWKPRDRCFDRVLRCTRCKTQRVQVLNRFGAIVSSHYVYADGYQAKGLGRIVGDGRDALRLEELQRESGHRVNGKSNGKAK